MEREVEGLDLSSGEWLELLSIRTTGKAKNIVDRAENLGTDNDELTVAFIWDELERQFHAHPQVGRQLLQQLQTQQQATTKNPDNLCEFASLCRQASLLRKTPQGTDLVALETPFTQTTITGRLDSDLRKQWKDFVLRTVGKGTIPFATLTDWIS